MIAAYYHAGWSPVLLFVGICWFFAWALLSASKVERGDSPRLAPVARGGSLRRASIRPAGVLHTRVDGSVSELRRPHPRARLSQKEALQ